MLNKGPHVGVHSYNYFQWIVGLWRDANFGLLYENQTHYTQAQAHTYEGFSHPVLCKTSSMIFGNSLQDGHKEHLSFYLCFFSSFALSPRGHKTDWNLRWQDKVSAARRGSKWLKSKNSKKKEIKERVTQACSEQNNFEWQWSEGVWGFGNERKSLKRESERDKEK